MAVFSDCSVVLDLKNVPFKEKKKLMNAILDNGGNISYVVNQKCSFVVVSSLENMSSSRLRSAQKHHIALVDQQYVWSCLKKGQLLPVQEHALKPNSSDISPKQAARLISKNLPQISSPYDKKAEVGVRAGTYLGCFRLYKEYDQDIPEFSSDFQVAKYTILFKFNTWSVLELQSAKGQMGHQYRVVSSIMQETKKKAVLDNQVHCCSSEDAVEAYLMLSKELRVQGFTQTQTLPPWAENLTSHSLQKLLLEEKLNCSTISQEVGVFVELIWTEALGSLSSILTVPVTSISLNDVSRVEGLLLQVQKTQCEDEVKGLLEEINTLLPLRIREPDSKNKLVSQKLDLCQLIRDILNMTEATLGNPCPSSLGKYRALRCSVEQVPPESPEFLSVHQLLQDRPAQIQQILRVSRGTELHMFRNELGNVKPLLHSTSSRSLVGILSRGLLPPRVGVEKHGIERTDIGNLGSGIYFSNSLHTSVKYSKPSVTNGCRLLLVCEVALGQCKDLHKRDFTLTSAPEGYNSVHGVRQTRNTHSDFEDDEYVVYNTDQIRLKYVVQYCLMEDEVRDFQPNVDTTLAPLPMISSSHLLSSDDGEGLEVTKNSLKDVTAGLLDSNGQTLPLQAVHVRCKLMDLLSQVVIFQTYTNNSSAPIEAKYVFPLEETAAVCGFEAFINGKHVIGKVKEKEQARKEYKQAIEKGHGAYLMDQDAPDVFTISVGNLPPGATVLIKVTFITELVVRAGTIVFSLPGSVAPWQQSSALNQTTQTTVKKIRVNELQPPGEFSLCMSIEMPYEIMDLECSHQIKIKRTDCKAVVNTLPDQTLSTDGFRLSFTLFQIHMPRMWVEKHPEKDTEACMLVFYPNFESSGFTSSGDVTILLDTSESMRGDAMLNARRIALKVLNSLDRSMKVNIISFGSDYKEAFSSPNVLQDVFKEAENFITSSTAVGGSTELWRPLRTLSLLPPSRGVRNVLLISDGHVHNQSQTLQLVRDNVRHTRLFTCGLSVTANRYMLRALAQAGGGTYEFFDTKTKYAWAEKVNSQLRCMVSPGCSSVAVKWQQFNPTAPSPVQAPAQLHALFNDCHTLVYGFVPHCTQATLFGDLSGTDIETMVSTTELQKTKGTFLHKLTARAVIRDFEDGSLGSSEAEHEGKKAELKSYIIELSKEFSILSQFTSFVAVEERDQERPDSGFTDVTKIISEEDVDILSYMGWSEHKPGGEELDDEEDYKSKSCIMELFEDAVYFEEEECEASESTGFDFDDSEAFDDFLFYQDTVLTEGLSSFIETEENPQEYLMLHQRNIASQRSNSIEKSVFADKIRESVPRASRSRSRCASRGVSMPAAEFLSASATVDSLFPLSNRLGSARTKIIDDTHQAFFQSAERYMTPICSSDELGALKETSVVGGFTPQSDFGFGLSNSQSNVAHKRISADICRYVYQSGPSGPLDLRASAPPPPRPPIAMCKFGAPAPPSSLSLSSDFSTPTIPSDSYTFEGSASLAESSVNFHFAAPAAAPPPPPGVCYVSKAPPPAPPPVAPCVVYGSAAHAPALDVSYIPKILAACPTPGPSYDIAALPPPLGLFSGFGATVSSVETDAPSSRTVFKRTGSKKGAPRPNVVRFMGRQMTSSSLHGARQQCKQPDRINWEELFNLQHQDGYWECTGALSRFLDLDVDFFANVFLKEKGICSLGARAHSVILKLVATMLVLQLIRVKKIADGDLLQSLFRLTDQPVPRPAHWDAVKKAVDWVCWADRQYPCVYSRLEFGWNWESCTRQLLGLDSLPPCSPLIPVLQRSTHLPVM